MKTTLHKSIDTLIMKTKLNTFKDIHLIKVGL